MEREYDLDERTADFGEDVIAFALKEARETRFFFRMIIKAAPELRDEAMPLAQEAKELHLIFAKIYRSSS